MHEVFSLGDYVLTMSANSEWVSRNRVICLPPRAEGHFPVSPSQVVTEHPPMLLVETHLLEMADHAHQD